ncbi:MAG TPA: terpene cyclase/mutase family protein [Syntrophorhabdaceae bacterium]|nr:terpene cyclase/mutase family protein [Syntrophorhabdaceae bacterium]HPU30465.1 terpene cyclase/mutase family protein [Syntrophorhabdaceae bacterium]
MKRQILLVIFLVLIPFIVFSQSQDVTKKSIAHIISVQYENGAWSRLKGEFPPEAEPTSWAVKVLKMKKVHDDKAAKGIDFILKDQKQDGSWNNNTAHTAFAIIALKQAGVGEDAIKKGLEYLRSVQDESGGFKRIGKEGAALTIYTAVVLNAFIDAGVKGNDPTVRKAIDWLQGCQNPDGGYGMPKGSPSLAISTAWTIRALLISGISPSTPFVSDAVDWLLKSQRNSGGFAMMHDKVPEDPEVTAYAIMALSKIKDKKDAIKKAEDYLAKVQHEDGSFTSNTPIQFNKMAKKNTQTTLFVAWALAELE